jgi:hypothetical protein
MKTTIILNGISFSTKKSVIEIIKKEISNKLNGQEFNSPIISDLIEKYHWYCSQKKIRPLKFKVLFDLGGDGNNNSYQFKGFFDGIGWKSVSWKKCLNPQTWESAKIRLLRDLIDDQAETYRLNNYKCFYCGKTTPPLHCHHDKPPFIEMAKMVDHLFTESDKQLWINRKWEDDCDFALPKDNPAVIEFLKIHSKATLKVLCIDCHKKNHQEAQS